MKQKVIEFFQNLPEAKHEQFNKAFELYRQSEEKSIAVERVINATGYTPAGLDNLLYDLQKLYGITDVEKVRSQELEVRSEEEVGSGKLEVGSEHPYSTVMQSEKAFYPEKAETLKLAPKLDAKSIRVEFPFLNEKDCPDEFKILIADKITAWNEYIDIQKTLSLVESGELEEKDATKLAELAEKAIRAFDENQKIYDELNCYQTTGKVLGVHPIFKKLQLTREIETMTNDELIKYKASSAKYFSVKKGALTKAKKAKDDAKVQEIEAGIAERSEKLFLVNKKLGV